MNLHLASDYKHIGEYKGLHDVCGKLTIFLRKIPILNRPTFLSTSAIEYIEIKH